MILVFGFSMFLGAALLFLVEPMLAKMMLPLLGGTPAVWNSCLVFFQAMLLAGYAYAHFSTKLLGARRQPWMHVVLFGGAAFCVPFVISGETGSDLQTNHPALWALGTLMRALGIPVFVLASATVADPGG